MALAIRYLSLATPKLDFTLKLGLPWPRKGRARDHYFRIPLG